MNTCQKINKLTFGLSDTIYEIESSVNMMAEGKTKKKVTKKGHYRSVPNIPIEGNKIKRTDTQLVSPQDIQKYKREINADLAGEKPAKPSKKKLVKDVDKMVMQPIVKSHQEETPNYQFAIKRNIIDLMGAAKKSHKTQTSKQLTKKVQSPKGKQTQQQNIEQLTSGRGKAKRHKNQTKPGPLPRHSNPSASQNPKSGSVAPQRSAPASNQLQPRKMQRLKKLFNVFQSMQNSSQLNNFTALFSGEVSKPSDVPKRQATKKSTSVPPKIKPRPLKVSEMKPKMKTTGESIIANLTTSLPPINIGPKTEKIRRKKTPQRKLLYTTKT